VWYNIYSYINGEAALLKGVHPTHITSAPYIYLQIMPPKTQFSIPMGKTVKVEKEAKKSKRSVRTTEAVAPLPTSLPSSKPKASGHSSGTGGKEATHEEQLESKPAGHPSHGIEQSHPLHFIESFDIDAGNTQGNVSIALTSCACSVY
jgi:hypothetical protein